MSKSCANIILSLSSLDKQMLIHWTRGIGLFFMITLSLAIAMHAIGFQLRVSGDTTFHLRFDAMPVLSSMHVIGGAVVLLTGGFQFWPRLRALFPVIHRWMGRIYLAFVLIGGLGGLALAPYSDGGVVAHFGFGLLAVLWLFSGWQAFQNIRNGDIQAHKEWMMRNYAMTFGAVTLRIYLGMFAVAGISFEEAYPTTAWISWVPNLILVEWYLVLTARSAMQKRVSNLQRQAATNPA